MKSDKYGAELLGPSNKFKMSDGKPGYAVWIESGVYYQAPEVDKAKFGPHAYHDYGGTGGSCGLCGCYMGESRSWGDCDPFGPCPENPNPFTPDKTLEAAVDEVYKTQYDRLERFANNVFLSDKLLTLSQVLAAFTSEVQVGMPIFCEACVALEALYGGHALVAAEVQRQNPKHVERMEALVARVDKQLKAREQRN